MHVYVFIFMFIFTFIYTYRYTYFLPQTFDVEVHRLAALPFRRPASCSKLSLRDCLGTCQIL